MRRGLQALIPVHPETERSVYCLRHTAICMRIILSHGKVNIFNLAKNAGTSVEQIETLLCQAPAGSRARWRRTCRV